MHRPTTTLLCQIAAWLSLCTATSGHAAAQQAAATPPQQPGSQGQLIHSLDGRELYRSYCASCHGAEGKGDGSFARMIKLAPPDLTQITVRHHGTFPTLKVQEIISGDSELAAHGTREMPIWGPIFSRVDWDQDLGKVRVANLTRYLKSLQAKPNGK